MVLPAGWAVRHKPPPKMRWEDKRLVWAVREHFVSRHSKATLVAGWLEEGDEITIESLMPENGVVFSDGIDKDALEFDSGTIARIKVSQQAAQLVVPSMKTSVNRAREEQ